MNRDDPLARRCSGPTVQRFNSPWWLGLTGVCLTAELMGFLWLLGLLGEGRVYLGLLFLLFSAALTAVGWRRVKERNRTQPTPLQ